MLGEGHHPRNIKDTKKISCVVLLCSAELLTCNIQIYMQSKKNSQLNKCIGRFVGVVILRNVIHNQSKIGVDSNFPTAPLANRHHHSSLLKYHANHVSPPHNGKCRKNQTRNRSALPLNPRITVNSPSYRPKNVNY